VENVPDAPKTPHTLEMKTANEKSFNEMVRFGVTRAKPVYSVQVQLCMKYMRTTRTLFVVTCKNDDRRHYERVEFIPAIAQEAEDRGVEIISANLPPKRMTENPAHYECKNYPCAAYDICFKGAALNRNCRTCQRVKIMPEGEWHCSAHPEWGAIPFHAQGTVPCQNEYVPVA
jgi:hypothetical protein